MQGLARGTQPCRGAGGEGNTVGLLILWPPRLFLLLGVMLLPRPPVFWALLLLRLPQPLLLQLPLLPLLLPCLGLLLLRPLQHLLKQLLLHLKEAAPRIFVWGVCVGMVGT